MGEVLMSRGSVGGKRRWLPAGLLILLVSAVWPGQAFAEEEIFAPAQNMCVDVANGNTANLTPILLWSCNLQGNQRFWFNPSGQIQMYNKCFDAAGGYGNVGDKLILFDCHDGANQKWAFQGEYLCLAGRGDRCLGGWPGAQLVLTNPFQNTGYPPIRMRKANGAWAYVFLRDNNPPLVGHVAWGFPLGNGRYYIGAVDGFTQGVGTPWDPERDSGVHTDYEVGSEREMLDTFKSGVLLHHGQPKQLPGYQKYKRIYVPDPNPDAGVRQAQSFRNTGYYLLLKNCMDETIYVLGAFGAQLPPGFVGVAPNLWMATIQYPEHRL